MTPESIRERAGCGALINMCPAAEQQGAVSLVVPVSALTAFVSLFGVLRQFETDFLPHY
jgi:hypothetical protein